MNERPEETPPADPEAGVQRVFTTREETRSYYNKIAKVYDLLAESSEGPMRDEGLKLLGVRPGERVLEIGFGTGHSLAAIAEQVGPGGRAFGIDLSDAMVSRAQELLASKGLAARAEVRQGDAEPLPYPDGAFDAIFMSFTLELFDTADIPKVLAECRRTLKPGGRVGVVAVSREGQPGMVMRLYEWTHKHFPNLVDCRPIYARRAFEASGFRLLHAEQRTMWVPVEIIVAAKPAG